MVVKLDRNQFTGFKRKLGFSEWVNMQAANIPEIDRDQFLQRGEDILAQRICETKLLLAVRDGLKQENGELDSSYLSEELEEAVDREGHHLKTKVLDELDLSSFEGNAPG